MIFRQVWVRTLSTSAGLKLFGAFYNEALGSLVFIFGTNSNILTVIFNLKCLNV